MGRDSQADPRGSHRQHTPDLRPGTGRQSGRPERGGRLVLPRTPRSTEFSDCRTILGQSRTERQRTGNRQPGIVLPDRQRSECPRQPQSRRPVPALHTRGQQCTVRCAETRCPRRQRVLGSTRGSVLCRRHRNSQKPRQRHRILHHRRRERIRAVAAPPRSGSVQPPPERTCLRMVRTRSRRRRCEFGVHGGTHVPPGTRHCTQRIKRCRFSAACRTRRTCQRNAHARRLLYRWRRRYPQSIPGYRMAAPCRRQRTCKGRLATGQV